MEDIKIVSESLPVIQINFEEIKTALSETLKKYKGIVVTEETLTGCKTTQKELAGVRIKIDTYRKDKKKELSKPIEAFESQCKELISLIEQSEQPIKEGIKTFDDVKREKKRNAAKELIKIVIEETELNEKYSERLDVLDKYCNLTAKDSEVKSDLEIRAMILKVEQDREIELIEIINDTIKAENERINTKLEFKDFARMVERGMKTSDILSEVKSRAEGVYRAENPPPKVEPKIEPQTEETKVEEQPMYSVTYRITGKKQELLRVSQFLKENRLPYEVVGQREV